MVESNTEQYKVQFIKYDLSQGYADYLIKVIAPGGITFHIKDRYSSMRNFQSMVKKQFNLKAYNGFPNFPPKKFLGSTSQEFLTNRMKQLQNFFTLFFQTPEISKFQGVVIYFQEKAADNQSRGKIEELIEYLDKKANSRSRPQQQTADTNQNKMIGGIQNQMQQDGPNKETNQNLIVQTNQNFDWKGFENDCKKIVKEISDKFIDLGLDDHNSEYGQDLIQKQEKFRRELDKREKDFKFDAETLQLPMTQNVNEDLLEQGDDHIVNQESALGKELNEIFDILYTKVKSHYMQEGQIIQFNE